MDSQIPYFCGDSEECRTLGSRAALQQVAQQRDETYLHVSVSFCRQS